MSTWKCPNCGEDDPEPLLRNFEKEIIGCEECVTRYFTDDLPRPGVILPPGEPPYDTNCPVCGYGNPETLYFIGSECVGCGECVERCWIDKCPELLEQDEGDYIREMEVLEAWRESRSRQTT